MEAAEVEAPKSLPPPSHEDLVRALRTVIPIAVADRLFYVADAMRAGTSVASSTGVVESMRRAIAPEGSAIATPSGAGLL